MCHSCVSRNPGLFPRKRESGFIPAKAGTQETRTFTAFWTAAFAGMTPLPPARLNARPPSPARGEGVASFG